MCILYVIIVLGVAGYNLRVMSNKLRKCREELDVSENKRWNYEMLIQKHRRAELNKMALVKALLKEQEDWDGDLPF